MSGQAHNMYGSDAGDPETLVRVGVGVIITDSMGRVLLERRRDSGMWGLPGGGIEPGETVIETAVRESKEETGFDIRTGPLVGIFSEPREGRIVTYEDNGDIRHLVDIVLTAEILSGEMTVSGESLELRFFNPDDLPPDIAPPALRPIRDYIAGMHGVIR